MMKRSYVKKMLLPIFALLLLSGCNTASGCKAEIVSLGVKISSPHRGLFITAENWDDSRNIIFLTLNYSMYKGGSIFDESSYSVEYMYGPLFFFRTDEKWFIKWLNSTTFLFAGEKDGVACFEILCKNGFFVRRRIPATAEMKKQLPWVFTTKEKNMRDYGDGTVEISIRTPIGKTDDAHNVIEIKKGKGGKWKILHYIKRKLS